MTNYEKIISLSVGELAEFIEQVEARGHFVSDSKYCDEACEHRMNETKSCPFGYEELPCMELKPIECITAWLNTETVEHDK